MDASVRLLDDKQVQTYSNRVLRVAFEVIQARVAAALDRSREQFLQYGTFEAFRVDPPTENEMDLVKRTLVNEHLEGRREIFERVRNAAGSIKANFPDSESADAARIVEQALEQEAGNGFYTSIPVAVETAKNMRTVARRTLRRLDKAAKSLGKKAKRR